MKKEAKCWKCKAIIQKEEKRCSHCGQNQYLWAKTLFKIILVLFLLMLFTLILSPKNDTSKISYGELLSENEHCSAYNNSDDCTNKTITLKVKIKSSYNDKATIEQNYFNIEHYIKNIDISNIDKIEYWAIADMSNVEESKIISFTIDSKMIQNIKENKLEVSSYEDNLSDLWLHSSLRN